MNYTDFKVGDRIELCDGKPRPPERFNRKLAAWESRNWTGTVEEIEGPRDYQPSGAIVCSNDRYPPSTVMTFRQHLPCNHPHLRKTADAEDVKPTYRFISDPGHGWLEVPVTVLRQLAIDKAISPYSYIADDKAYLEEDCDSSVFATAAKARGHLYDVAEVFEEYTPIRSMAPYPASTTWQSRAERVYEEAKEEVAA